MCPELAPGRNGSKTHLDIRWQGREAPDHVEVAVRAGTFTDGHAASGGNNSAEDFQRQIRVQTFVYEAWPTPKADLLACVDDGADGFLGHRSLYDVLAYGVFDGDDGQVCGPLDRLRLRHTATIELGLVLPRDLPDPDDDRYQGDALEVRVLVAGSPFASYDVIS